MENTGSHMFYGKSLKLITRCHFHGLFCLVHTLYALAKLSVLIVVIKKKKKKDLLKTYFDECELQV